MAGTRWCGGPGQRGPHTEVEQDRLSQSVPGSLRDVEILVVRRAEGTVTGRVPDLLAEGEEVVAERGRDDRVELGRDLLVEGTPGIGLRVELHGADLVHLLVDGVLREERRVVRGTGAEQG